MGIYLSRPLTSKDSDVQESAKLAACSTDMQGWRVYMEDAHILYLDSSKDTDELALFGVFDGHGGPAVSRWVSMKFIDVFKAQVAEAEAALKKEELLFRVPPENLPVQRIAAVAHALERTFLGVDTLLSSNDDSFEQELRVIQNVAMRIRKREMALHGIEEPTSQSFFKDLIDGKRWRVSDEADGSKRVSQPNEDADKDLSFQEIYDDELMKDNEGTGPAASMNSEEFNISTEFAEKRLPYDPQSCGCTAVVAALLVVPEPVLVVANAGDSRCVLSRNGIAKPMTVDHKPMQEREMTRIQRAGGTVANGRVDGNLNLSRSLGDLHYKRNQDLSPGEQKISAVPDLTYIPLCQDDDFVILACDGIWDILSEQACVEKVHTGWAETIAHNKAHNIEMSDAEICKKLAADLCDHCLAPTPFDPDTAGAGCDNMTAMVIRIKDEWRRSFPSTDTECAAEAKLYGTEAERANYQLTDATFRI